MSYQDWKTKALRLFEVKQGVEAERDRYKKALEKISALEPYCVDCHIGIEIARSALKGEE